MRPVFGCREGVAEGRWKWRFMREEVKVSRKEVK